jgi:hypothetical protein
MANRQTLLDLHVAACVLNTATKLVNRRDSGVSSVSAKDGVPRRVKGVIGRTADAGYFLGLLDGEDVFSANGVILNAFTQMIPVDIGVPAGKELSFYYVDTAGTALATLTVLVEEPE